MKKIWIMNCSSESGDHYNCCAQWDHKPSQEEIDRERIKFDACDFDEEIDGPFDKEDDFHIEVDGKKYPVPEVLLSGNHAQINKWREKKMRGRKVKKPESKRTK